MASRKRWLRTNRIGILLRCLAVGLSIWVLGVLSGPAAAADSGRLRLVQVLEDGKDGVDGLFGAFFPTVSPDGANVYVAGSWGAALAVFARDARSGRLTFLEAQRNGVNGVDGLGSPIAVAVSPDGAHVYVASQVGAIAAFARDPLTGRLTFVQAQSNVLPGPDHSIYSLIASPDGAHVYASGPGAATDVAVFARDAASGVLTPIEVVSTGVPPTAGFLAVSPDGAHVYAAGFWPGAVTAFQRDPTTGRLTRLASWREGVDGVQGLAGANIIALSADGASVYVAGYYDYSVAVFARDAGNGIAALRAGRAIGRGGRTGPQGSKRRSCQSQRGAPLGLGLGRQVDRALLARHDHRPARLRRGAARRGHGVARHGGT